MATAFTPSTVRYIGPARPSEPTSRKLSVALWTVQSLLALIGYARLRLAPLRAGS